MEEKKDAWVRLPLRMLNNKELSHSDVIIMALLIDRERDDGTAAVSIAELCKKIGLSERQVKRCIKRLEENRYIKVKHTGRENVYQLMESLPPKKRSKKQEKEEEEKRFKEDYEIFLNAFG